MAVGLTIDSQSLDIVGAWEHDLSLGRLLGAVQTRGENRLIPNLVGRRAYLMRPDEVVVDMQLEVYGDKDSAGAAHANVYAGLSANLVYLREFVLGTYAAATQTAVLEVPGGDQFTTEVQILNWQIANHGVTVARIIYDLRIPSGTWTEVV